MQFTLNPPQRPGKTALAVFPAVRGNHGTGLVQAGQEPPLMRVLNSKSFWNKKLKIAMLALATFIAMC